MDVREPDADVALKPVLEDLEQLVDAHSDRSLDLRLLVLVTSVLPPHSEQGKQICFILDVTKKVSLFLCFLLYFVLEVFSLLDQLLDLLGLEQVDPLHLLHLPQHLLHTLLHILSHFKGLSNLCKVNQYVTDATPLLLHMFINVL